MKRQIRLLFFLILVASNTHASQVLLDGGVKINGLWCFPSLQDTTVYYYLPNEATLSLQPNGLPAFSMLRYVENTDGSEPSKQVISKATGGAIVHFLLSYGVQDQQRKLAENGLRQQLGNDKIVVKGPIIFSQARYALVSSILTKGKATLLTAGDAPVLEGGQLAFSFQLSPADSKLFLESFKMATPDLSLIFDFTFSGLSQAYNAEMEIEWSKLYSYEKMKSKGGYWIFKYEAERVVEELFQENAIRLHATGEDKMMDGLIELAHEKATNLLFSPIDIRQYRTQNNQVLEGILDAVDQVADRFGLGLFGGGFEAGYTYREIRQEGISKFSFNKRTALDRHHFITFNIGDLFKKYGENPKVFKTVNLADPDFEQREVYIGLDGQLNTAFKHMVNNVTVVLKKEHEDGTETLAQQLVRQDSLGAVQPLKFVYGNRKDTDRSQWLHYQYKTIWHFQGGGQMETDWETSASAMISLFVPYEHRTVFLDGDVKSVWEKDIQAIVVSIEHPFFDQKKVQRQIIRKGDVLDSKNFQLTLAAGQYSCDYEITWVSRKGNKSKKGLDKFGVILIDEIPQ
ncbi:MAG: hypothetical protein KTR30_29870 [Saprospiraceae bacterium]|nr:hypothetical protein [Saprospiraceae bacterium]